MHLHDTWIVIGCEVGNDWCRATFLKFTCPPSNCLPQYKWTHPPWRFSNTYYWSIESSIFRSCKIFGASTCERASTFEGSGWDKSWQVAEHGRLFFVQQHAWCNWNSADKSWRLAVAGCAHCSQGTYRVEKKIQACTLISSPAQLGVEILLAAWWNVAP